MKQLTEEPAYPTSLRDAIERIDESVESIRDSVDRLERVDAGEGGRKENADAVDEDDLYERAREFVVAEGKASTSLLQRRFKVGYGRACRIMDALEGRGVIAKSDGTNRPREVLLAGSGGSEPEPLEEDEKDEHLDAVVAFARAEGRISPSMIQRRFRVGYGRAARILDQLEQVGVVGPSDGRSGVRAVIVDAAAEGKDAV